jgi:uncharacterized protein
LTKKIKLQKSVYELTEEYPELIPILKEMGFLGVINPVIRRTLGKKMTLPQGCGKQGQEISTVTKRLEEKGFSIE